MEVTVAARTRQSVIRGYVSGVFIMALNAGIFFQIGVQEWLKGDPAFWVCAVAVPIFLAGAALSAHKITGIVR
jgi:hypothetical protein